MRRTPSAIIADSIAADATYAERDRQGARAVAAARAQAQRTRAIADAYADTLAEVRRRVQAQLTEVAPVVKDLPLPVQRLVASCTELEVRSGEYVASVILANASVDSLTAVQDTQIVVLTREAHPRWYRRALSKIKDAPVPFLVGALVGALVVRHPP